MRTAALTRMIRVDRLETPRWNHSAIPSARADPPAASALVIHAMGIGPARLPLSLDGRLPPAEPADCGVESSEFMPVSIASAFRSRSVQVGLVSAGSVGVRRSTQGTYGTIRAIPSPEKETGGAAAPGSHAARRREDVEREIEVPTMRGAGQRSAHAQRRTLPRAPAMPRGASGGWTAGEKRRGRRRNAGRHRAGLRNPRDDRGARVGPPKRADGPQAVEPARGAAIGSGVPMDQRVARGSRWRRRDRFRLGPRRGPTGRERAGTTGILRAARPAAGVNFPGPVRVCLSGDAMDAATARGSGVVMAQVREQTAEKVDHQRDARDPGPACADGNHGLADPESEGHASRPGQASRRHGGAGARHPSPLTPGPPCRGVLFTPYRPRFPLRHAWREPGRPRCRSYRRSDAPRRHRGESARRWGGCS